MATENLARSAGILLHPTSLPGPFGIGDFGATAYWFVDQLARAKQRWWQLLPLGPTGYGDSPYQSYSAFAGNPLLISPGSLVEDGLIAGSDLENIQLPDHHVDYSAVMDFKQGVLTRAWENFQAKKAPALVPLFEEFCASHADWVDDFALFMAIRKQQNWTGWQDWPRPLMRREPQALAEATRDLADEVGQHKFRQFLFFRQWSALRQYAREREIRLIGDIPIFISSDSVDIWANPDKFLLDEEHHPTVVSGVPPDYFAETGQLWGNPHYNWEVLRQHGYDWWVARVRATLEQVDWIRLDHFCGFESAWHVQAGMPTAEEGEYVAGPRADFFEKMREALGGLPFIAEDLGVVTPEVEELRDQFNLPGMLILQFAFGGATENRFLPHNYIRNAVVYTGTHDNDTTLGWYETITENERDHMRRYSARDDSDPVWDLIRLAWASVADYAIAPLQDVLRLGSEARMNFPGKSEGNWSWRFTGEMLTDEIVDRLGEMTELYGRCLTESKQEDQ